MFVIGSQHTCRRDRPRLLAPRVLLVGLVAALGYTARADTVECPSATGPAASEAADTGQEPFIPMDEIPHALHALIIDETARVFRRGDTRQVDVTSRPAGVAIREDLHAAAGSRYRKAVYTSRVIRCPFPVNTVIASWNVELPENTGLVVMIRLGRRRSETWTPFYYLGSWGAVPARGFTKTTRDRHGLIDIDYFRSKHLFDRVQYRVLLFSKSVQRSPTIRRFALAVSHTLGDAKLARRYRHRTLVRPGPRPRWVRRLDVPFFSQRDEDPDIAHSVCSPISVAMVMAYHGVRPSTTAVCELIWDREYKIYGNWLRAVQTAFHFGLTGYVQRFGDWNTVKHYIARGIPVVASIRVPEAGMLRGSPYPTSNGHLLVITGFDEDGSVHVNDPYGKNARTGRLTYDRRDMERVWFAHGGVGYVILPPGTTRTTYLARPRLR